MSTDTDHPILMFQGKEIEQTIRGLLDAATEAADAGHGPEFMAAYRAINEHADSNIGYIIGYIGDMGAKSARRRTELNEKLGVGHPVFGGSY